LKVFCLDLRREPGGKNFYKVSTYCGKKHLMHAADYIFPLSKYCQPRELQCFPSQDEVKGDKSVHNQERRNAKLNKS